MMKTEKWGLPSLIFNNEKVSMVEDASFSLNEECKEEYECKLHKLEEINIGFTVSNSKPLTRALGLEKNKKIRLPRKEKKRRKKMLAKMLGISPNKFKMIFPNRKYKIEVEYEED